MLKELPLISKIDILYLLSDEVFIYVLFAMYPLMAGIAKQNQIVGVGPQCFY